MKIRITSVAKLSPSYIFSKATDKTRFELFEVTKFEKIQKVDLITPNDVTKYFGNGGQLRIR